jgi:hypothetical protein
MISEERRTGYAWQRAFGVPETLERAEGILEVGRDKWLANHKPSSSPAQKAARAVELEPRVREIIAAFDEQGRWITPGKKKYKGFDGPWVDMGTFESNFRTLCEYLEVVGR